MPKGKGTAGGERELQVHLLPQLVPEGRLKGGTAIVIDVLRATTTIVHALAAGCTCVRPCCEIDEAKKLADGMRAGKVILAGERGGEKIPGFDRGNSPREFTTATAQGLTLVLTTTNGTRAMLRAAEAERVILAAFVNFSAACEQVRADKRPLHIICAGTDGEPSVEDTLLAGAFVDVLCERYELRLNDTARMAWDCFENNGPLLRSTLEVGRGGQTLKKLGYDEDIAAAAEIDSLMLVPELKRDPLRIEIGSVGVAASYWPK
jgi:2-phosphosulfolactate phosphatase